MTLADFQPLDEAAWASERAALGDAQPLSRLVWFGGLLAGKGTLAPGYDPEARYQLLKWPQTEREFPKHFRIATAMMKGPATLPEIAEASGVPLADVTDFVNASLATGFAEPLPRAGARGRTAEAQRPVRSPARTLTRAQRLNGKRRRAPCPALRCGGTITG